MRNTILVSLCLVLMVTSLPALADVPPKLALFSDNNALLAFFREWRLKSGSTLSTSALRERYVANREPDDGIDEKMDLQLEPRTSNCRLFGSGMAPCSRVIVRRDRGVDRNFAVALPPYQYIPVNLLSNFLINPSDPMDLRKDYINRGVMTFKINRETPGVEADSISSHLFNSKNVKDVPGFDVTFSLVPADSVGDARQAWSDILAKRGSGLLFDCEEEVCRAVYEVVSAGAQNGTSSNNRLYAVCSIITLRSRSGKAVRGQPGGCRVVAAEIAGVRYLLAVTGIALPDGWGAAYVGTLEVTGIGNSEGEIRDIVGAALTAMRLEVPGGPRNLLIAGRTPRGEFSKDLNTFISREINVYAGRINKPIPEWDMDLSIWVYDSILNRRNDQLARPDLEAGVKEEFIQALSAEMRKSCHEVQRGLSVNGITLKCNIQH